jgi:hypothetical protein
MALFNRHVVMERFSWSVARPVAGAYALARVFE